MKMISVTLLTTHSECVKTLEKVLVAPNRDKVIS